MPQELLIAIIAAAAALVGSLLGSLLTRTTEHKQWHRDEKKQAYIEYIAALQQLANDIQHKLNEVGAPRFTELRGKRAGVRLFGSVAVRTQAREAEELLTRHFIAARKRLNPTMTSDERNNLRSTNVQATAAVVQLMKAMRADLRVSDPEDDRIEQENDRMFEEGGTPSGRPYG